MLAWNVPWSLQLSWRDLQSFPFYCFSLLLCIIHLRASYLSLPFSGTPHSVGYIFSFLPYFSLLFFPQLFLKPPQKTILPFCISFSWEWFWSLPPVQCYKPLSIVLQALGLPDLIPWIYSSPPLYNHKGFDLDHTWMARWFYLLSSFKPEFCNKELMIWDSQLPGLVFADCIELHHLQLQRI